MTEKPQHNCPSMWIGGEPKPPAPGPSKVLNVTPAEYSEIHKNAFALSPADFEAYMVRNFECDRYQVYRVVVRKDVPSVPWYSKGVGRIEEAKKP